MEYPFDTIKVLSQINNYRNLSTMEITRGILLNEGFFRVFRGMSAPVFGSSIEYFITFWLFGMSERYLISYYNRNKLTLNEIGFCGAFSGIGIGLWLTPIEFIKCQMQVNKNAYLYNYSTLQCLLYHLKHNPFNLMHGLSSTLFREGIK